MPCPGYLKDNLDKMVKNTTHLADNLDKMVKNTTHLAEKDPQKSKIDTIRDHNRSVKRLIEEGQVTMILSDS